MMTNILIVFFCYPNHLKMYLFTLFMAVYRGVYALEEHGEGYFYPHGWQHDVWIGPLA
jgi:hypothetical protein